VRGATRVDSHACWTTATAFLPLALLVVAVPDIFRLINFLDVPDPDQLSLGRRGCGPAKWGRSIAVDRAPPVRGFELPGDGMGGCLPRWPAGGRFLLPGVRGSSPGAF